MNIASNNELKCTIALAALQEVRDPEIGLNIVDLGLIRQVDFREAERKVVLTMTLTTQFCPMGASITENAEQALQTVFAGDKVIVLLTFDPPWNYERISEDGRKFLEQ
ncbi:MAG: metal-sulfur cluster assembly factor [Candidatus Pseudobacter hemicellulosilyticus]|uniref:Metal-sulfur cluster assembly factor n=1 Tax=Candidatus Pseudobacter hemicellulosilyticus TaxID=3121375 RepID=A0AAJ6BDR5_9BACT|nr:MAG: metal-sulfur cluster assembly factor [Pseudobacter sp.]